MAEETTENFVSTINVRELISIFENKKEPAVDYSYSRPRAKSWGNILADDVVVRYNEYYTLQDIKNALTTVETNLNFYLVYDKQKHVKFQEQLFNILTSVINIEVQTEDDPLQKKNLITKTQTLVSVLNQKLPNVRSSVQHVYTKNITTYTDENDDSTISDSSDTNIDNTNKSTYIDQELDYSVSVKNLKKHFQPKDETIDNENHKPIIKNTAKLQNFTTKKQKSESQIVTNGQDITNEDILKHEHLENEIDTKTENEPQQLETKPVESEDIEPEEVAKVVSVTKLRNLFEEKSKMESSGLEVALDTPRHFQYDVNIPYTEGNLGKYRLYRANSGHYLNYTGLLQKTDISRKNADMTRSKSMDVFSYDKFAAYKKTEDSGDESDSSSASIDSVKEVKADQWSDIQVRLNSNTNEELSSSEDENEQKKSRENGQITSVRLNSNKNEELSSSDDEYLNKDQHSKENTQTTSVRLNSYKHEELPRSDDEYLYEDQNSKENTQTTSVPLNTNKNEELSSSDDEYLNNDQNSKENAQTTSVPIDEFIENERIFSCETGLNTEKQQLEINSSKSTVPLDESTPTEPVCVCETGLEIEKKPLEINSLQSTAQNNNDKRNTSELQSKPTIEVRTEKHNETVLQDEPNERVKEVSESKPILNSNDQISNENQQSEAHLNENAKEEPRSEAILNHNNVTFNNSQQPEENTQDNTKQQQNAKDDPEIQMSEAKVLVLNNSQSDSTFSIDFEEVPSRQSKVSPVHSSVEELQIKKEGGDNETRIFKVDEEESQVKEPKTIESKSGKTVISGYGEENISSQSTVSDDDIYSNNINTFNSDFTIDEESLNTAEEDFDKLLKTNEIH